MKGLSLQIKIFTISNDSTFNLLDQLASKSNYIIAVGSCASLWGVHSKFIQNSDICGLKESLKENNLKNLKHEIINLWLSCSSRVDFTNTFYLKISRKISIDEVGRTKGTLQYFSTHGCTKNEYFGGKLKVDLDKRGMFILWSRLSWSNDTTVLVIKFYGMK